MSGAGFGCKLAGGGAIAFVLDVLDVVVAVAAGAGVCAVVFCELFAVGSVGVCVGAVVLTGLVACCCVTPLNDFAF
jgi:hypothetical protein